MLSRPFHSSARSCLSYQRIEKYIKKNPLPPPAFKLEKGTTVYHVTSSSKLPSIMEHGLYTQSPIPFRDFPGMDIDYLPRGCYVSSFPMYGEALNIMPVDELPVVLRIELQQDCWLWGDDHFTLLNADQSMSEFMDKLIKKNKGNVDFPPEYFYYSLMRSDLKRVSLQASYDWQSFGSGVVQMLSQSSEFTSMTGSSARENETDKDKIDNSNDSVDSNTRNDHSNSCASNDTDGSSDSKTDQYNDNVTDDNNDGSRASIPADWIQSFQLPFFWSTDPNSSSSSSSTAANSRNIGDAAAADGAQDEKGGFHGYSSYEEFDTASRFYGLGTCRMTYRLPLQDSLTLPFPEVSVDLWICVRMYLRMHTSMCACICVCVYLCMYLYVNACVCVSL